MKQYLEFYYLERSPIQAILELSQVLAISALSSKTVKKIRPPDFFLSPLLATPSSPLCFHDISHLPFSYFLGTSFSALINEGGVPLCVLIFLILQKKRQQIYAKGVGKENQPSMGQERTIRYVTSRTSLHW